MGRKQVVAGLPTAIIIIHPQCSPQCSVEQQMEVSGILSHLPTGAGPRLGGISGFFDMIIMVIIMIMIIIMMIAIRDNDRHTSTTFLCYILPKNIVD